MKKLFFLKIKLLLFFFLTSIFSFSQNNNYQKSKEWSLYKNYHYYLKKKPKELIHYFYFKSDTQNKEIAITFDDGPHRNTEKIISFLLEKEVPATFFLVAKKINKNNIFLYQNDLFEVGMHTFSHLDYTNLSKKEKEKDITQCIQIFKKFNLETNLFRPAYGVIDTHIVDILNNNHLKGILWSLDALDWNGYKKEKLINHVVKNIHNGSVILFHDRINILDLKEIINKIELKGFKIISLSELMQTNSSFPY